MATKLNHTGPEASLKALDRRIEQAGTAREQSRLRAERNRLERELYANLSAIDRVRMARHPARPQTLDYLAVLIRDFFEIHGDRRFSDDCAIVAGLGYFGRYPVAIVGQQRGRSTSERIRRNFGKPNPEGPNRASARRSAARPRRSPATSS
jgi:acetyl-CoA carboxylase carboxyl transferase subunit alpha